MKNLIEEALKNTTDTKHCVIGAGVVGETARVFGDAFPSAEAAIVIDDANTKRVAGDHVLCLLREAGITASEHTLNPDGSWFHATYDKVEEVRTAIARVRSAAHAHDIVPVAVGSGTINDLVKRASEELGLRYMTVGTAASMDGYTSFGASITKDGMKQTLPCKAPLACIVDSEIAAKAPPEMTASGYADLLAKVPAGADWLLADAIGSEAIHSLAWRLVQGPLREALANPVGCSQGDEKEIRKLCEGLVMSGFAMQAMGSSRPASGTEHQVSHYWDMEDLSFEGRPVSHGFKVGIGTLVSTKTLEFLLRQDIANLDVDEAVSKWWPDFATLSASFPRIYGDRPNHIRRAEDECAKKFPSHEQLRAELTAIKGKWPILSMQLRGQLMPFSEVRSALKAVGAPYEPEMIGVTRARFRETCRGVQYMRVRYFGLDLVSRIGKYDALEAELFGPGGIWEVM